MAFVVDASVTLAWHFADEADTSSEALFACTDTEALHVPPHWFVEVSNALLVGERRERTTARDTADFVERLGCLDIVIDGLAGVDIFARVPPLARAHRLSAYDALYLELAERLGLPLATRDKALAQAARSVGVQVLG
jgi:predicted nucleic acid-binding protein